MTAPSEPSSRRVLLVDDEENIRIVIGRFLAKHGYHVVTACDGQQALERFDEARPDLVLVDLCMPRINGPAFLRELRRRGHDVPAIVTSGAGTLDDVVALFRIGIVDYLKKPFSCSDVLAAVQRAERRPSGRIAG